MGKFVLILFASFSCLLCACSALSIKPVEHKCILEHCGPESFLDPDQCKCITKATMQPPIRCPDVHCPISLLNCGQRELGTNGCPTCKCKCARSRSCPYDCPFGIEFSTDAKGCKVCKCREKPLCPPVCAIHCPFGKVLDRRGCPTCQCSPRLCITCKMYCPFGRVIGPDGCEKCECKDPPFVTLPPPPRCRICKMYCPFGKVKRVNGCEICKCKDPPFVTLPPRFLPDLSVTHRKCGSVCAIYCPFGKVLDERGCPTCQCKQLMNLF